MKLLGIDFTSAPSRKKPITVCVAQYCSSDFSPGFVLQLHALQFFSVWEAFEELLNSPDSWFAAMDFPFALPADWVAERGWPQEWQHYMEIVNAFTKLEFETLILDTMQNKPSGQKYSYRKTDRVTRSSSPLKLFYPPVGKMFFQGATRLWQAPLHVIPQRPLKIETTSQKFAVEAYPALIARRFTTGPYKADTPSKQTEEKRGQRLAIWKGIHSESFHQTFGFWVDSSALEMAAIVSDPMADVLDAVLCCLQAAWGYSQRENDYGVPAAANRNEGWISDPVLQY